MAIFNQNLPASSMARRRREFRGNWGARAKLALTGSNADGSDNFLGEAANVALPVIGGALSTYFLGNYQIGSKLGSLANKGLDNMSANILEGTDTLQTFNEETAKNERQRSIIDAVGSAAGSIYTGLGGATAGNKPEFGTRKENRILDKALEGTSDKSIGSYLQDFGTNSDYGSSFDPGNFLTSIAPASKNNFSAKAFDPNSALYKFFGQGQNNIASNLSIDALLPQKQAGQSLSLGKDSSVNGMLGDGIYSLDEKKQKPKSTFESSLPYNMYEGFADGGEVTRRNDIPMTYRIPKFASKLNPTSDIKKKTLI